MRLNAGLVATSLRQDSPSDPRQLVGERNAQNIAMHAPGRRRQPRSKAMLCPTCRSEQDGTGALDEEHAQIAVSALGDTAKDGVISRWQPSSARARASISSITLSMRSSR